MTQKKCRKFLFLPGLKEYQFLCFHHFRTIAMLWRDLLVTFSVHRTYYIAMIGQVPLLRGYLKSIIGIMDWVLLGLCSQFIILSLGGTSLEKQWNMLTKPLLLVFPFDFTEPVLYSQFYLLSNIPYFFVGFSHLLKRGFWESCYSPASSQVPWNSKRDWSWYLGSIQWQLHPCM